MGFVNTNGFVIWRQCPKKDLFLSLSCFLNHMSMGFWHHSDILVWDVNFQWTHEAVDISLNLRTLFCVLCPLSKTRRQTWPSRQTDKQVLSQEPDLPQKPEMFWCSLGNMMCSPHQTSTPLPSLSLAPLTRTVYLSDMLGVRHQQEWVTISLSLSLSLSLSPVLSLSRSLFFFSWYHTHLCCLSIWVF